MILFISAYPDRSNEREGMMQRIAAMDSVFADATRAYLLISYKRNLLPRSELVAPGVTVYRVNLYLHFWYILYLASKASVLYVHSLYHAIRVLPLYLFFPVVTDMHGLVPEELAMEGDSRSRYYQFVEALVVRRSKALVTVTSAMAQHLSAKYRTARIRIFKVPIFEAVPPMEKKQPVSEKYTVIYTGGTQKWQNVELMLQAAKSRVDDFEMIFLTGDQQSFRTKLADAGIEDKVVLDTVPKHAIYAWYQRAHFGFVLRDDVAVNNVACPTKLVEYLAHGVVPIVIQPNIGDFASYGYSYILLSDFLNKELPDRESWAQMVRNNLSVMERHREIVSRETQELAAFLLEE